MRPAARAINVKRSVDSYSTSPKIARSRSSVSMSRSWKIEQRYGDSRGGTRGRFEVGVSAAAGTHRAANCLFCDVITFPQSGPTRWILAGSTRLPRAPRSRAKHEAVVLANLQLGWETERWSARLFVDNVTDELVYATSAYSNFAFGFDVTWYAGVAPPRVVGLVVEARW
jgi:outer membrane receptor protein involved in Fe transport